MRVSAVLFLATAAQADNVLYLTSLTCDASYPVTLSDIEFSCDQGCNFGASGNLTSSLSYANLGVQDLYTTAKMNFTAFTNGSAYDYQVSDAGFSQQMFFGSMVDLCENTDDSSCDLDEGNFNANFEYSIPSAGDLNDYFAGYTVQSDVRIYDYYNNMGLVGDCVAMLTTAAPNQAQAYQKVASNTAYFLAAAAAALALVYVLPLSNKNANDEKKVDLLNKTFSDDNDPDVIERERSVFKGLSKPSYEGGYDFDPEVLSPVNEETPSAIAISENKTTEDEQPEQIVTEEIPWPSKDDAAYDAPDAPISEITNDIISDGVPPAEKSASKEEISDPVIDNRNSTDAAENTEGIMA